MKKLAFCLTLAGDHRQEFHHDARPCPGAGCARSFTYHVQQLLESDAERQALIGSWMGGYFSASKKNWR
jgi:hypothetical protein